MSAPPESAPTPETAAAEDAPPATPAATTTEDAACEYDPLDDLDLPPLRIHARQVRDRLSASSLTIPPGIQSQIQVSQKRYSLDNKSSLTNNNNNNMNSNLATASPTGVGSIASSIASARRGRSESRSRSPSMRRDRGDGNSSFSSLEDFVDSDILYDKLGFVELENKEKSAHGGHLHHNSYSGTSMTPVSERMSEDTLEDVHAFSDLSANTNTRPSSSVGTGGSTVGGEVSSHVLEPLDEGDEDLESEDDVEDGHHRHEQPSHVIVTNLENITLQDPVL